MTSPQPDKKITAADAARTADPLQAKAPQGFLRAMFERYREWSEPGLREARLLKTMDAYREGLEQFGKTEGSELSSINKQIAEFQQLGRGRCTEIYNTIVGKIDNHLASTSLSTLEAFKTAEETDQVKALKSLDPQLRGEVLQLLKQLQKEVAPHLQAIVSVRAQYDKLGEASELVKEKFLEDLKILTNNYRTPIGKIETIRDGITNAFKKASELQSLEGAIEQAKTQGKTLYEEFKLTRDRINPDTKLKVLPQEEANFVQVPEKLAAKLRQTLTQSTRGSKQEMVKAFAALNGDPSRETLQAFKDAQATFKEDYDKVKEVFQAVASQLEGLSQNYSTKEGSEELEEAPNGFDYQCSKLCAAGKTRLV